MNNLINIKPNPIQQVSSQQEENEQIEEQKDIQTSNNTTGSVKPDYQTCKNYTDRSQVIKSFPHLQSLEDAETIDFEAIEDAYAFIIRSNNDDDIHKAIKYGVWTSTPPNNDMLNEVFTKAVKENKQVYLFYSVVKSGQFVGVARLASNKFDETFELWWQGSKWRGHFKVEWYFIKDVNYKNFENLQNSKGDPVIRSKDGTPVDWKQTGQKMMKVYKEANTAQNIFNDFSHMDSREQYLRYMRAQGQQQQHVNPILNGGGNSMGGGQNNQVMGGNFPPNYMLNQFQMGHQMVGHQQTPFFPMGMMIPQQQQFMYQQQRLMNAYPPNQQHFNNHNQNHNYQHHNYNNHNNYQGQGYNNYQQGSNQRNYHNRGNYNSNYNKNNNNNYHYQKKEQNKPEQ